MISYRPLAAAGQFAGLALGIAIVLSATIVGAALFQHVVAERLDRLAKYVHRASTLFLVGSCAYLAHYWVAIAGLF